MSGIDILCEHSADTSCPACEAAVKLGAAEARRENRAQAEWERTLRQWEEVSEQAAEATRRERGSWDTAESEVRREHARRFGWNLLWRLLAILLSLQLLASSWMTVPAAIASLAGGVALALYRASRRRSAPHPPDGSPLAERARAGGPWRALPRALLQIPAIGAATCVVAVVMAIGGGLDTGMEGPADIVFIALFTGALIWATGFRRVPMEESFGRRLEDHTEVQARLDSAKHKRFGYALYNDLAPASERLTARRDELARLAGAQATGHDSLEAVRLDLLERRRAAAAERASLLDEVREKVAEQRVADGRPLLDAFAAQLSGHIAWGSVGQWSRAPWYEALPGAADDLDNAVRVFTSDLLSSTSAGMLPDGPHPTVEITDDSGSGRVITVVALRGKALYLCHPCPKCDLPMLGDKSLTTAASLLEAANLPLRHTCAAAPQAAGVIGTR